MPLPSENDVTFRTTDPLKWGVGKGSRLTSTEVDNNFWYLLLLIAELSSNPALPLEIQSIDVSGGQITITMSDGVTTFGPFDLPSQAFRWRGDWTAGAAYLRFDVVAANDGAYLILQDHTADTAFDPLATTMSGPLYALMFPYQNIYDISFFYPGQVGIGLGPTDTMFALRFAREAFLLADLPLAQAGFDTPPVDGVWTCNIFKNADLIGDYTFDPFASSGGGSGVFTFPDDVQFEANDVLRVERANNIDSAARGFSMTIAGRKGTLV